MIAGDLARRRVVVVGAGTGAGAHLRALREIGCQVVAVVTRHPDRSAAARALFPRVRVCWPAADALSLGADVAIVNVITRWTVGARSIGAI